jgi:tRNA nucleotidyltransferase (CCA-adding enzyme)
LRLLGRTAADAGARSYLVGGPVRDIMLGRQSPDFDLAVEGDCAKVGSALARRFGGRFVYHSRFRTGTLLLPDGGHIDIARARTETYSRPAVLPTVQPAPIERDLVRRDFTINAMAVELSPGRFGRLLDPHAGRADLTRRVIRILQPGSFSDDPTRIFRAIRFAVRLEFDIEAATLVHMRSAIAADLPALLTPERALYELRCFCAEERAPLMFEAAGREGLLRSCFRWRPGRGFLAGLQRLNSRPRDPELLLLHVLADLPDDPRFPLTREQRQAARSVRQAATLRARLARARRPSTVYRLLKPVPVTAIKVLAALGSPDSNRAIGLYLERLAAVTPLLGGRDLAAIGLRPGPTYRAVLEKLRAARLDGRVRTREDELALARRLLDRKGR